jgi:TolB-like protein
MSKPGYCWKILALSAVLFVDSLAADPMRMLINPFKDLVGRETQWIGLAVQATLLSDFGRLKGMSVISEEDRMAALKEMEFQLSGLSPAEGLAKMGRLAGANVMLSGEYAVMKDQIRITARVASVESGVVLGTVKETGALEAIFSIQDSLIAGLLKELNQAGSSLSPPAATAPPATPAAAPAKAPRTLEFFKTLGQGLEAEAAGDYRKANAAFNQALQLEPLNQEAAFRLAFNSIQIGDLAAAERLLKRSLEQIGADPPADALAASRIYFALGRLASERDDSEQELKWFIAARDLLDKSGQPVDQWMAKVTVRLGEAYRHRARNVAYRAALDQALQMYEKGRGYYETLGLTRTLDYAQLLRAFGNYFLNQRSAGQADAYFQKTMQLLKSIGQEYSSGYADLLSNLADLNRMLRKKSEMQYYYAQAAALYDKLGMQARAADTRRKSNEALR